MTFNEILSARLRRNRNELQEYLDLHRDDLPTTACVTLQTHINRLDDRLRWIHDKNRMELL